MTDNLFIQNLANYPVPDCVVRKKGLEQKYRVEKKNTPVYYACKHACMPGYNVQIYPM